MVVEPQINNGERDGSTGGSGNVKRGVTDGQKEDTGDGRRKRFYRFTEISYIEDIDITWQCVCTVVSAKLR